MPAKNANQLKSEVIQILDERKDLLSDSVRDSIVEFSGILTEEHEGALDLYLQRLREETSQVLEQAVEDSDQLDISLLAILMDHVEQVRAHVSGVA